MLQKTPLLLLALAASAGALLAQGAYDYPLPPAIVGVPYSFDLGEGLSQVQLPADSGITFSYSFKTSSPPPGLTLQPSGLLSGAPTTAGTFPFTIDFAYHLGYMGQSYDFTFQLNTVLQVSGSASGQQVTVDPRSLTFGFSEGAASVAPQSVSIGNRTSQTLKISASAASNGDWLSVAAGAFAAPFSGASVLVAVNPRGLAAGTYTGKVSISVSSGQTFDIPVIATVTSNQSSMNLSQTGLRFQTVQGGGAPPPQTISVLAGGTAAVNFSVSSSTLSGGPGWLSVTPGAGASDSSSSGSVAIAVNPAGLAPGDYYGQIQFSAPGVSNAPQTATVVLNVLPPNASPGAQVQPTGLIFVARAGGSDPAAKTIGVSNPSPLPLSFAASTFFENGSNWFTVQPASGSVSTGQPAAISVQPSVAGLAVGVYKGEVALRFGDASVRRVEVLLIVIPGGQANAPAKRSVNFAAGCVPTRLIPVFTQLGAGFKATAAWPTPLEVSTVDDCGTPMVAGSVVASFSSGDPALALTSLRDGRWSGTWQPRVASSAQVTITAKAQQIDPALQGSEQIGGALQPNAVTPVIAAGGAVSAVNGQAPLAPGSFVAIYGSHLSAGVMQASSLPLSVKLGGTQAILAGKALPLLFTSEGQVNAVIPNDVPPNTTQQLIVQQGASISVPEPVTIAPAQPAVFAAQGLIVGVRPDGSAYTVDANHPASAKDTLVLYTSGLGPVSPEVPAGSAAPSSPLAMVVTPIAVTIGGVPAHVLFAGLAPTFAGLYQVNVTVPDGVAPGSAVPLVITALGQQSVPVNIPVK